MGAKGTSEECEAREGVLIHSHKGLGRLGSSHEKTLKPKMSVEVTQINFVTNFACGKQHIIQALQVGVFKHVSNTTTKVSTYFFFIWSLVVWFLFCNFHRIFPLGIAFTFCTLQCSHGENSGKKKFMVGKSQ